MFPLTPTTAEERPPKVHNACGAVPSRQERPVSYTHLADKAHHSDGEQGVEVIGDSGNKRGKIAGERPGCPEVASHRGGPAGNRRDHCLLYTSRCV